MSEKKRNSVFFQASGWKEGYGREKTKNENLIVIAGCGENRFSFFEFPSYIQEARFDPEYAERVANSGNGTFSLVGWPEPDGNLLPIYFRAYLTTLQNFFFVSAVRLPIGDAVFAYDGLLPLPDGSVFQIAPWGDWDAMQAAISAAQKRRDASERSADWTARMSTESKSEIEKRFGVDLQKRWKDKGRCIPESQSMPEPANVSSPEVSSPSPIPASPFPRSMLQLDIATGEVSFVDLETPQDEPRQRVLWEGVEKLVKHYERDFFCDLGQDKSTAPASGSSPEACDRPASLPLGFVAVPLPDDGKPVLDYCRKPGWYLTRGVGPISVTYNVGTGVPQHDFPWVSFDSQPNSRYKADTFYDVNGSAWGFFGDGRKFERDTDFDIVMKYMNPAAETATVSDAPDLTVGDIQEFARRIEKSAGSNCDVRVELVPKNTQGQFPIVLSDLPSQHDVVPVEHYNQATEQFSKFRGEVSEAFAMLAKAFGVCDCRCGDKGGEGAAGSGSASHAREDLESKLSESRAEVHALNKRIAELARALGSEKQVSVELDAKCDRLTQQWVGITEIVEKLKTERDAACRERDELATKFGAAMAQLDLSREELAKLQAEREPRDNGDGTVTRLLPVTHPKGLPVEAVRAPKRGEEYFADGDTIKSVDGMPGIIRLILRPAPKPPEPVTWEAPLVCGEWCADDEFVTRVGGGGYGLKWGHVRGLSRPAILGKYQFKDGVGTLIEAADGSGKAGS